MVLLARDARGGALLAAWLASCAAGGEALAREPTPRSGRPGARGDLHGYVQARYRGRATGDDQDHDLRGVAALDYESAGHGLAAHLLLRADADLDGRDEGSVFAELSDAHDGSVDARLYAAHVDLALGRDPGHPRGTLFLGRRTDVELPEVVRLDGIGFRSHERGERALVFGLYGGVPVHLDESSSAGDLGYGTFAEGLPWSGARARFDWMHLEDEQRLGSGRDDLLGLSLWQRLARAGWLEGRFTRLEGANRDLDLRARLQRPASATTAGVRYHELLETQSANVLELDPFTEELQELHPYRELGLDLARPLGRHVQLDLGFDLRRVRDAGDVGEFNREWERLHATATLGDLLEEGLALALTGERWDDDERSTDALGADLTFDPGGSWRVSLGTSYALYKYALLELEEREDVRTTYLRASRALGTRLRLDLVYELEDDDLETYHLLSWGATWRF